MVLREAVLAYILPMDDLKSSGDSRASYATDFYGWTAEQARLLRASKPAGIDWENLAEEIESLGKSDRRAVGSALKVVLEHLVKWRFQSGKRTASWSDSIDEHRDRIARILEDSPSLAALPAEILESEYRKARRKALRDTRLPPERVPEASPFSVDQAVDPDFWPAAEDRRGRDPRR
jgi:hypothetical protein